MTRLILPRTNLLDREKLYKACKSRSGLCNYMYFYHDIHEAIGVFTGDGIIWFTTNPSHIPDGAIITTPGILHSNNRLNSIKGSPVVIFKHGNVKSIIRAHHKDGGICGELGVGYDNDGVCYISISKSEQLFSLLPMVATDETIGTLWHTHKWAFNLSTQAISPILRVSKECDKDSNEYFNKFGQLFVDTTNCSLYTIRGVVLYRLQGYFELLDRSNEYAYCEMVRR